MTRAEFEYEIKRAGWKKCGQPRSKPGNDSKYQCYRKGNEYLWLGNYYCELPTVAGHAIDYVNRTPTAMRKILETGEEMNELARSTISAKKLAAKWNETFPVGTRVRYWTGVREGLGKESVTSHTAQVLCGAAVIWLQGVSGCIALSHVEPIL